jgi:hypothetical protein
MYSIRLNSFTGGSFGVRSWAGGLFCCGAICAFLSSSGMPGGVIILGLDVAAAAGLVLIGFVFYLLLILLLILGAFHISYQNILLLSPLFYLYHLYLLKN